MHHRRTRKHADHLGTFTVAMSVAILLHAGLAEASKPITLVMASPDPVAVPVDQPAPAPAPAHREPLSSPDGQPTQAHKDIVARACRARFDGADEGKCYYRILAMTFRESRFNCKSAGDQGRSHGCLQIRTDFPGRPSIERVQDYATAVDWTLDRLVAHGYETRPYYAIQAHNGIVERDGKLWTGYADKVRETAGEYERAGL